MHNTSLETMAMTEKQQEKLQVCDNNWERRIARLKRIDKRRMKKLREEVGVRVSLVRSLLKWAGCVERMEMVRLTKTLTAYALRVEGSRRSGTLRLELEGRMRVGYRGEWRWMLETAVKWD